MRYLKAALILFTAMQPVPLFAQASLDGRVNRLEQEVRAIQRTVFPNGAGKMLQPEVTAPETMTPTTGTPASAPISDLTARVSAIEAQFRSMTGEIEQNNFRLRQLEEQFARYKANMDAQAAGAAGAPALSMPTVPTPAASTPAAATPTAAAAPAPKPKPADPVKPAAAEKPAPVLTPSADRKGQVAAIERPDTGNAAEDGYAYGFRLWEAKLYPEAQAQLKATVDSFGTTSVASRAQNLLGRAYLDDGKPGLASRAFYENYEKRPDGDRAADSLTYLGEVLIQLKKPADACRIYQELESKYGATLKANLRTMVNSGRDRAKCGA